MKTLEGQFFKFCCKNIDHNCKDITTLSFRKINIEDKLFSISNSDHYNFIDLIEKYVRINPKVSKKQLCYYIDKWKRYGFINYGWFDFSNLPLEYFLIVPDRILSHCKAFETENMINILKDVWLIPSICMDFADNYKNNRYKRRLGRKQFL